MSRFREVVLPAPRSRTGTVLSRPAASSFSRPCSGWPEPPNATAIFPFPRSPTRALFVSPCMDGVLEGPAPRPDVGLLRSPGAAVPGGHPTAGRPPDCSASFKTGSPCPQAAHRPRLGDLHVNTNFHFHPVRTAHSRQCAFPYLGTLPALISTSAVTGLSFRERIDFHQLRGGRSARLPVGSFLVSFSFLLFDRRENVAPGLVRSRLFECSSTLFFFFPFPFPFWSAAVFGEAKKCEK